MNSDPNLRSVAPHARAARMLVVDVVSTTVADCGLLETGHPAGYLVVGSAVCFLLGVLIGFGAMGR